MVLLGPYCRQFSYFDFVGEEVFLDLEPNYNVEVVGYLICLDADF